MTVLNIKNVIKGTMFYISELLLIYIPHEIERNTMVNSYMWVIVLPRDTTGKHPQSGPPPPAPPQAFGNMCGHFCCWCQYGWESSGWGWGWGREVIMHGDSPKMLIEPPLRNTVLGGMQIWEQSWIAQNNTEETESWCPRTFISTHSPCRAPSHL